MVGGRVVAGLGGGGLTTIAVVTMSDLVSVRDRGVFQGISNVVFGLGSGFGGFFGGWVSERWGWRWAFGVQVPVIVISTIVVAKVLDLPAPEQAVAGGNNQTREYAAATTAGVEQETEIERQQESVSKLSRVDFPGSVTLVTALILLLTALNSGGNLVPWTHSLIITSLFLAGLFLVAFVHVETYISKEPIIPLHLLVDQSVLAACLVNWFMVMGVYTMVRTRVTFSLFFILLNLPFREKKGDYILITLKNSYLTDSNSKINKNNAKPRVVVLYTPPAFTSPSPSNNKLHRPVTYAILPRHPCRVSPLWLPIAQALGHAPNFSGLFRPSRFNFPRFPPPVYQSNPFTLHSYS